MNVPNGAGQKSSVRTHNTTAISEAEHLKFSVYYHTWALIYFLSSSSSSSRMTLTPLNNAGGSSCYNHGWDILWPETAILSQHLQTWLCLFAHVYFWHPCSLFDLSRFLMSCLDWQKYSLHFHNSSICGRTTAIW